MKHLKRGRKFGRVRKQRHALLKSLATALFTRGRITTTEAKAKELRPFAEKIITKAKRPTIATVRDLRARFSEPVVKRIVAEAERMRARRGGYARITKMTPRMSDSARMAIVEFLK